MATYQEIAELKVSDNAGYDALVRKIAVAATVKAQAIADDVASTANGRAWALKTLKRPLDEAGVLINYVIAKNNTATVSQILSATDTAIQTAVDGAVDTLFAV